MNFSERKRKLEYLLEIIQKGQCHSLSQISEKFEISKRTAKRMITLLRENGNNIKYCRTAHKFYEFKD